MAFLFLQSRVGRLDARIVPGIPTKQRAECFRMFRKIKKTIKIQRVAKTAVWQSAVATKLR